MGIVHSWSRPNHLIVSLVAVHNAVVKIASSAPILFCCKVSEWRHSGLVWIQSKTFNGVIEVLHRLPRHLFSNFQWFIYTAIHHVDLQKPLNVQQHSGLVENNWENFCHYVGKQFRWTKCLGNLSKTSIPS